MADLLEGTLPLNLVAIDIARYSNAVLIELSDEKRQRFRLTNSAPDFDRLLSSLQALPGNCWVALEPTGDYHRPLAHRLLTAGHEVVSINSVAQARYREAMFNSWDKNDPKDAQVILEMLRRGTYQRYVDPQIAGFRNTHLPTHFCHRGTHLGLLQSERNLLFGESLLHVQSPDYVIGLRIVAVLKSGETSVK